MASPMLSKCAAAYASVPFYPALLGHCIFMVGLFKGRYERLDAQMNGRTELDALNAKMKR